MKRRRLLIGTAALPLRRRREGQQLPQRSVPHHRAVRRRVGDRPGARNVAEGLNCIFGAPAVVENKPGANGAIAAEVAAKAKPDGQTIFVCSNTAAASNVAMMKSLTY